MTITRTVLFTLGIAAAAVGCGKKQAPATPASSGPDVGNGTDTSGGAGSGDAGSAADPNAGGTATDGSPPQTRTN